MKKACETCLVLDVGDATRIGNCKAVTSGVSDVIAFPVGHSLPGALFCIRDDLDAFDSDRSATRAKKSSGFKKYTVKLSFLELPHYESLTKSGRWDSQEVCERKRLAGSMKRGVDLKLDLLVCVKNDETVVQRTI